MTSITPSTVYSERLSMGGGILYLSPTVVTSKDSLPADFRNVGLIEKDNSFEMSLASQSQTWKGGTPSRDVFQFLIGQELNVKTSLSEIDHQALSWVSGEELSYTVGTPSTTVAATPAPTATTFTVASATGFAVKDLIEIDLGTGGTADKHYRWIKTISGSTITLGEALPEAPAAADTVNKVSKVEMFLGYNSTPVPMSLKYVKVLPVLNQKLTIVLFKVITAGQLTINFQDDAKNILPFDFKALSDANVHNGALGVAFLETNA